MLTIIVIILGGSRTGQVVLWDITNKLSDVETEEILTPQQKKYRIKMFSFMGWMKNIRNLAYVPVAAISDGNFSHNGTITDIQWLPHDHFLHRRGQIYQSTVGEEPSLQFVTSSEDGTMLFWDLSLESENVVQRAPRKIRRLKKRPSGLMADVSKYR